MNDQHEPTNASPDAEKEYLLGTDRKELERLGFQHRVWAETTHGLWRKAGFAPGHKVLDLGCGPGFASLDLAYLVGNEGAVLAVDESPRFLRHLDAERERHGLSQIQTLRGDAQTVDLPEGALDGAYARWLLCFLRSPEQAIARVARALRPGGTFAILDYYNYVALTLMPRGPVLDRAIQAVVKSWNDSGGDLDIGGRLPALFLEHGLRIRSLEMVVRAAQPGEPLWHWPRRFFFEYVPRLIELGYLAPSDEAALREEWLAREQQPGTFFMTPPMVAIVGERV